MAHLTSPQDIVVLVCHCHVVNDRRIRAEIERGARDEFDIARACGAGTDCGGCVPTISRLLDECATCPLRPSAAVADAQSQAVA